jgi:hypothetical protein
VNSNWLARSSVEGTKTGSAGVTSVAVSPVGLTLKWISSPFSLLPGKRWLNPESAPQLLPSHLLRTHVCQRA